MVREGLHERATHAAVEILGDKTNRDSWSTRFRHQANWNAWSAATRNGGTQYDSAPVFLRLVRRGQWCAGFASSDGEQWEQIGNTKHGLAEGVQLGLALFGSPAVTANTNERPRTTCEWIAPKGLAIPVVAIQGKTVPRKDEYTGSVRITMSAGDSGATILYTVNGQEPDRDSAKYTDAIAIDEAGDYEVRARILKDGELGGVVNYAVHIKNMP
jgi:hypothetical protein